MICIFHWGGGNPENMEKNNKQFFEPQKINKNKKIAIFSFILLIILAIIFGALSLQSKSAIFLYISWTFVYLLAYMHGKIQAKTEDGNLLKEIDKEINIIDKIKNSNIVEYKKIIFEEKIKKLINNLLK